MELSLVVAEAAAMAEGSYWLRWQTLVCGLIVVLPAVASVAILARARAEPLRAVDFWAPCWAGMHPAWLLAYRGLVFLVMSWLLLKTILPVPDGLAEFYFYTQWTFTIVLVYFLIGTVVSARGCWLYSKRCITQDAENNRWQKGSIEQNNTLTLPFRFNKTNNTVRLQSYHELEADRKGAGFWEYAMQLIYQTSAGAAVLTDVVFWVVLVPFLYANNLRVTPTMSCMHSLNAVFLLFETFLNSLSFPLFRMAYFILWSCIYVTLQWFLHARGFPWWPYPFMELDTPWSPLWYFGMALVHVPCYGLFWSIAKAKSSLCPYFFPRAYRKTY